MRRKEKEVTDRALIEEYLQKAQICRVAMVDGEIPYIVPMNFGYKDGCMYLHSAKEGRKLDIISKNNNVCFEAETAYEIVESENPCNWSAKFISIIGNGRAYIVDTLKEKREALDTITGHYSGKAVHDFPDSAVNSVAVIKIVINEMTCKKSGY